jgi:hypothetical protein
MLKTPCMLLILGTLPLFAQATTTTPTPQPKVQVPFQISCGLAGTPFCVKLNTATGQVWVIKFAAVQVSPANGGSFPTADTTVWEKQLNSNSLGDGTVLGRFTLIGDPAYWMVFDQIGGTVWLIQRGIDQQTGLTTFSFAQIQDQ